MCLKNVFLLFSFDDCDSMEMCLKIVIFLCSLVDSDSAEMCLANDNPFFVRLIKLPQ